MCDPLSGILNVIDEECRWSLMAVVTQDRFYCIMHIGNSSVHPTVTEVVTSTGQQWRIQCSSNLGGHSHKIVHLILLPDV